MAAIQEISRIDDRTEKVDQIWVSDVAQNFHPTQKNRKKRKIRQNQNNVDFPCFEGVYIRSSFTLSRQVTQGCFIRSHLT